MQDEIEKECRHKMEATIDVLQRELAGIRTGRASTSMLDSITIDYYGTATPLNQVANISIPENRMMVIQPWDASNLQAIEKAVLASDLGITPQNDGKIIRLALPPLSEERRKELAKLVKKTGEDNKIAVRNVRHEGINASKRHLKAKEMSEDEEKKLHNQIQKVTDEFIGKIDTIVAHKEKEILEH